MAWKLKLSHCGYHFWGLCLSVRLPGPHHHHLSVLAPKILSSPNFQVQARTAGSFLILVMNGSWRQTLLSPMGPLCPQHTNWRYKTLKLFPSSLLKWSTQLLLQGPFPLTLPHSSWEAQHDSPFGSQALPSIVVTFSPSQGPHQLPLTHVFFPSLSLSPSTMENLYPTSRWEASSYALISFSKVTSSPIKHFPHSPMPSVSWANELCTPLAIQGWTERWPVKKE